MRLQTPLEDEDLGFLEAGCQVLLSGWVYTARDSAHQRLAELIRKGRELPFDLRGQVLYYTGPSPAPPGCVVGSVGPTTASRMDPYTPALLSLGLKATIGKGRRSPEVRAAMLRYRAVYLAATGGAGVLLAGRITASELVAYPELGPEAIFRLTLLDFPLVVINDFQGRDLYLEGKERYCCNYRAG